VKFAASHSLCFFHPRALKSLRTASRYGTLVRKQQQAQRAALYGKREGARIGERNFDEK